MSFKTTVIAAMILVTAAIVYVVFAPRDFDVRLNPDAYTLSPRTETHILMGDATGGGHKCGARKGKSEFSCDWSDAKIIRLIKRVANDNNAPLRRSGRYWARIGEEEGTQLRVLLDKEKHEIVTAYPLRK